MKYSNYAFAALQRGGYIIMRSSARSGQTTAVAVECLPYTREEAATSSHYHAHDARDSQGNRSPDHRAYTRWNGL